MRAQARVAGLDEMEEEIQYLLYHHSRKTAWRRGL